MFITSNNRHQIWGRRFPPCAWFLRFSRACLPCIAARQPVAADFSDQATAFAQFDDATSAIPHAARAELAGRIAQAMCFVRQRLDSTRDRNYAALFLGSAKQGEFPPRFGYLVGAVLADRIDATLTLDRMAKLPPDAVKLRPIAALAAYGRC